MTDARTGGGVSPAPTSDEPRRTAPSLHADNIALSRRPTDQQPYAARARTEETPATGAPSSAPALDHLEQVLTRALAQLPAANPPRRDPATGGGARCRRSTAPVSGTPNGPSRGTSPSTTTDRPASGPRFPLWEGTVIETVLLNRLDGTFAGPVACLVTTPVYSQDRQRVVIPAGARVLGAAAPVQAWGDARSGGQLSPAPHAGRTQLQPRSVQRARHGRGNGSSRPGRSSLRAGLWRVARHRRAVGSRAIHARAAASASRTSATSSANPPAPASPTSASRVLDRYLNVLPTDHDSRGPSHQGLPHQRSRTAGLCAAPRRGAMTTSSDITCGARARSSCSSPC